MSAQKPRRILLEQLLDQVQAFALYHYLDAHGIPVSLPEQPLRAALGEIPFLEAPLRLYLDDPARLNEARDLIRRFQAGPAPVRGTVWQCGACGEVHEPEFGACWKCGADRP